MWNIGSLVSGLGAWLFAVLAISSLRAFTSHKNTLVSFSLCAISLVFQLLELNRRVILGDYAAIDDTLRAILIASTVLVCVTILLNLIALRKSRNK